MHTGYKMQEKDIQDIFRLCCLGGFQTKEPITNADLGKLLNDHGKSPQDYGYEKLKDMLKDLPFFTSRIVNKGGKNHIYLSFDPYYSKQKEISHKKVIIKTLNNTIKAKKETVAPTYQKTKRNLEKFTETTAIPKDTLINLAEYLALPEKWYFGPSKPESDSAFGQYPILIFYLNYTYMRLKQENKIFEKEYKGKKYRTFNTGLVDKKYDGIFALCKENEDPESELEWYLLDFVVPGEEINGKLLRQIFDKLPEAADYFSKDPSVVFFNTHNGDLDNSYGHMIIENCRRLPPAFIKFNCGTEQTTIDGITIEEAFKNPYSLDYEDYFQQLQIIMNKDINYRRLSQSFKNAVDVAVKKAKWNYKTAVPIYYPQKDCISLLLPLSLVDENKIDVALVIERYDNGNYQGQTILTMYQAYKDSRLLTRPDSEWLTTDNISNKEFADDED